MNTEIKKLIENILIPVPNFKVAYAQLQANPIWQKELEGKCNIDWQYCGIIAAYSGVAFRNLNTSLRGGGTIESVTKEYVDTFSILLSSGLNKLDSYNSKTLCRNEKCPLQNCEPIYKWYKSNLGKIVLDPAYVSTSANWQPANGRIMFKIKTLESNSKAKSIIPIMNIFQPTRAEREKEILFDKNTLFRIDKVENNIIHLEEVIDVSPDFKLDYKYWEINNTDTIVA